MAIENGKSDTKGIIPAHYSDDGNQYVELADSDGDKLEIVNGAVKVQQGDLSKDVDSVTTYPSILDVVLQNVATVAGNGTEINVEEYQNILISITGTNISTSTVVFEGSDVDGNWTQIQGVKTSDLSVASSTNTIAATPGEKWDIQIARYSKFRARISTITGASATLTITGRMST